MTSAGSRETGRNGASSSSHLPVPSLRYRLVWVLSGVLVLVLALEQGPKPRRRVGNVLRVLDGDTLVLLQEDGRRNVRISSIDAPERDQPWGQRSREFLARLVEGRKLRSGPGHLDIYGRVVAELYLPDGRSVAQEMIREGMAWHFRRFSHDPELTRLEDEAREARRGLWSDPEAIPPWRWRDTGGYP